MDQSYGFKDQIQIYKINEDGTFGDLILETNNNPTPEQIEQLKTGDYQCAADRLTDNGLQDITNYLYDTYAYIGLGTDGTTVEDTANELIAPYGSRIAASVGTTRTYCNEGFVDTVTLMTTLLATESVNLCESGVFKEVSSSLTDVMLARQTFCVWSLVAGQSYGIIWRIISARG